MDDTTTITSRIYGFDHRRDRYQNFEGENPSRPRDGLPAIIDGDTTTLERLLEDYDDESVIEEGRKTLHISVPSKSIDITVDKKQGELRVNADGRKVSVKASETDDEASVTIRRETDAADSAKTTRGSAARSR